MEKPTQNQIVDRALGCMLGLAVGDAVGTTLEFRPRDSYEPLTDMVGGGPFDLEPGQWTDDTSMALCLADSMIACGGLDQRDLLTRFVRWYRHGENSVTGRCFDIGITTQTALVLFERTGELAAGSTEPDAAGNGSIMRLAPVAIRWCRDPAKAIAAARAQSITTHGAAAAVEGCAMLVRYLLDAIATGDPAVLRQPRHSEDPAIAEIGIGLWQKKRRDEISSTGYVVHTLEAALWAVDQSACFEEAVLLAANLGDDADTVAAVAGQLAGAIWGRSDIPARWLECLAWRAEIEERVRALISGTDAD